MFGSYDPCEQIGGADLPAIQSCRLPHLNSRDPSRRTVGRLGIRPNTPVFCVRCVYVCCILRSLRSAFAMLSVESLRVVHLAFGGNV